MISRIRDWWTFLWSPWRAQIGRDEIDIDVLGRLNRLEVRVTRLEQDRP